MFWPNNLSKFLLSPRKFSVEINSPGELKRGAKITFKEKEGIDGEHMFIYEMKYYGDSSNYDFIGTCYPEDDKNSTTGCNAMIVLDPGNIRD